MQSIWIETQTEPRFPALEGEHRTDVLVIGGGMAGILCAHKLHGQGVDCTVLEAGHIGGGTTQNTTAKISAAHGLIYHKLLKRLGKERTALYYQAQQKARDALCRLASRMDCELQERDAYIYDRYGQLPLEKELSVLQSIGAQAEWREVTALPFFVKDAICYPGEGQMHPLKLLYALAKPLRIFEESRVIDLTPHRAITAQGAVTAKKIIVATHFPFLNKHGGYFLKQYQSRSYVLALKNAPDVGGMYLDGAKNAPSFRNYNDLLLLGGGAHRTGKKSDGWEPLLDFARGYYPNAEVVASWAAQDCMTLDEMPYIGQYGKHTPDLLVASGFQKWGMSGSMLAATVLCDLILEKVTPSAALFSPQRAIWHPQLAVNGFEAVLGMLYPTARRCPHLGCALRYNPHEHSWDCSCHGSRFSHEGKVLDNPANGNLRKRQ